LLAQGIGNLGAGIGQGISGYIQKHDQLQEQDASNQMLFNTANNYTDLNGKPKPLLSEEERQQFLTGNAHQRNGIGAQIAGRIAQQWQRDLAMSKYGVDP